MDPEDASRNALLTQRLMISLRDLAERPTNWLKVSRRTLAARPALRSEQIRDFALKRRCEKGGFCHRPGSTESSLPADDRDAALSPTVLPASCRTYELDKARCEAHRHARPCSQLQGESVRSVSMKCGREVLKNTHIPVVPRSAAVLHMNSTGRLSDTRKSAVPTSVIWPL